MTADIINLPTEPRPVTIERGMRVMHRDTGEQGFAFKVEGDQITVARLGTHYRDDIRNWRPA